MKKIKAFFQKIGDFLKKIWIIISEFIRCKLAVWIGKGLKFIGKYTGISWLAAKYRKNVSNKHKKAIAGYLFIGLWIIGFVLFAARPVVQSIRMATSDYAETRVVVGEEGDSSVKFFIGGFGISQFKQIFKDNPDDVEAIVSTLVDIAVVVPLVLIFSLLLALLLHRKLKGIKIFRMIFFIPVILLSGNLLGYFNSYDLLTVSTLQSSELQGMLAFYLPEEVVDVIINVFGKIILILWFSGVQTLVFLAGLQKDNNAIYEAASIDGANKWEMFWKITFPTLMPLININIIYTTVIYANTGNELTRIISERIAPATYGRDYASALSWMLFGIEIVVIFVYVLIFKLANRKYK
ncbi:MAG: sugar ABC transporter permease [Bacilli bacterium]|nr:sugar ABC transporter permease [Bacilli bacterium]MBP5551360.1 sugar ABC transporter permease [Bacilli bacterium]